MIALALDSQKAYPRFQVLLSESLEVRVNDLTSLSRRPVEVDRHPLQESKAHKTAGAKENVTLRTHKLRISHRLRDAEWRGGVEHLETVGRSFPVQSTSSRKRRRRDTLKVTLKVDAYAVKPDTVGKAHEKKRFSRKPRPHS